MKKFGYYLYSLLFWISRIFTISIFVICLLSTLIAKYILSENSSNIFTFFIKILDAKSNIIVNLLYDFNIEGCLFYDFKIDIFGVFCKNSQGIDLLLIALVIILILSMIIVKFINKGHKYLLALYVISSIVYLTMYSIFKLPIMLALTISTPIAFITILFLNKTCPMQKIIMLIPVFGEICCTKVIIKHIFQKTSSKATNISLLITALILANIICFLFPYKTNKDFENKIMDNWTYSIRPYQDKLIISGDKELIIIDKREKNFNIKNDEFVSVLKFVINKDKKEIYLCNFEKNKLLIIDIKKLNIMNEIVINGVKEQNGDAIICCDNNFSKLIIIYERCSVGYLIDLNMYTIKYIKNISFPRNDVIYNKYRNCFLISFYDKNKFLQEIDIENKKIRKIKADKYQGYIAMSKRNKEIYVAFHQQGRIGVYDAETMKLKRKIKSNYTVKDITYDEELNILIAPSYFTGYVDIFLMDGTDKLLTREFVGYELREGCFDPQKENLYVCSRTGLYKKKIDIKKLIEEHSNNKNMD